MPKEDLLETLGQHGYLHWVQTLSHLRSAGQPSALAWKSVFVVVTFCLPYHDVS